MRNDNFVTSLEISGSTSRENVQLRKYLEAGGERARRPVSLGLSE